MYKAGIKPSYPLNNIVKESHTGSSKQCCASFTCYSIATNDNMTFRPITNKNFVMPPTSKWFNLASDIKYSPTTYVKVSPLRHSLLSLDINNSEYRLKQYQFSFDLDRFPSHCYSRSCWMSPSLPVSVFKGGEELFPQVPPEMPCNCSCSGYCA